ncbi:MAG: cell division protein FtsH, partial [Deltaproteobacteria bacterium]|nr:cell division protein FtsH [Deltaproteobacteria bacterium]
KMVCNWGMSEEMGPLTFGKMDEQVFLGREIATHKNFSEETAEKIDREMSRIVTENYERAKKLLSDNIDTLHKLSKELLEKEVLNAEELDEIVGGKKKRKGKRVKAEKPEKEA